MKIEFKAMVRDAGTSYVITIPMQYVKDGKLKEGLIYSFGTDGIEKMEEDDENDN